MTRLVTYRVQERDGIGVAVDGGIVDLSTRLAGLGTVGAVLAAAVEEDLRAAETASPDVAWDQVELLPPVLGAEKIVCVGINYPARAEEYARPSRDSAYPNLFVRFPGSFVGHQQPLVRPSVSTQLDYEGEIVLVVGRGGRHISAADAFAHIGGVTIGNDGTVRDWVTHASRNVTQGKNFDASGSIGPWVVPTADIDLRDPLDLQTRVNGIVRQKDSSARLLWGFAELIEYVSTFTTLLPGDLLFTGTPTGSGSHSTPPIWLEPGDVVDVEVSGIGVLSNPVIDEE